MALFPDPSPLVNGLQLEQTPVVKRRPMELPVPWEGPQFTEWEVKPAQTVAPRLPSSKEELEFLPLDSVLAAAPSQAQPGVISQEHFLVLAF